MAEANLPVPTGKNDQLVNRARFHDALVDQFVRGRRPAEIARLIHPTDRDKRRVLRNRIWYALHSDELLARRIYTRAQSELLMALVPTTVAMAGRAARGRPDAGKLIYEASGFHNPRVKHDHTGEIKLTLNIPRPQLDEQVVDADVVE